MGSYNMTCFASKHTVSYGDKAYLLPIYQKGTRSPIKLSLGDLSFTQYGVSDGEGMVNTYWTYAGPVLETTYDDCGQFILTDTLENKQNLIHFFNILHEKLFKVIEGEDSYREYGFDFQSLYNPQNKYSFEELTQLWNQLFNIAESNRLFLLHKEQPRQLQFAVLHHRAFDFFQTYCNKLKQDGKTLRQTFDGFVQDNIIHTLHPAKEMKKFPDMIDTFNQSLDMGADILSNLQGMRMGNCFNYWSLYDNKKAIVDIVTQFVANNPKATKFNKETLDNLWSISGSVLTYRMIHLAMSHMNIQLTPMNYGGQDEDNEIGRNYLKFIKEVNQ